MAKSLNRFPKLNINKCSWLEEQIFHMAWSQFQGLLPKSWIRVGDRINIFYSLPPETFYSRKLFHFVTKGLRRKRRDDAAHIHPQCNKLSLKSMSFSGVRLPSSSPWTLGSGYEESKKQIFSCILFIQIKLQMFNFMDLNKLSKTERIKRILELRSRKIEVRITNTSWWTQAWLQAVVVVPLPTKELLRHPQVEETELLFFVPNSFSGLYSDENVN